MPSCGWIAVVGLTVDDRGLCSSLSPTFLPLMILPLAPLFVCSSFDARTLVGCYSVWLFSLSIWNTHMGFDSTEWSLQEPHKELGLRAAEKCTSMRLEGCEDMGSLVMGVAADLIEFDFSDAFVNAFEVANKCSEILMMREGLRGLLHQQG